jgi:putative transposase
MVTSGTYQKHPHFRSQQRLTLLSETLLRLARESAWQLQAWAVFSNHYHFVGISQTSAKALPKFLARLHAFTALAINRQDDTPGRRVWFEYWDSQITNEKAYFARLNYVHNNAVKHGLVRVASRYPWCSAGWFELRATPAFFKTVMRFPCDRIRVPDDFTVNITDIGQPSECGT